MSEEVLNKPSSDMENLPNARFVGAISGLYGDVLQGWAMDTVHPDQRLIIEIFINGASVALVKADQFSEASQSGDFFHGFAAQLHSKWLSEARCISAGVANQNFWLDNSLKMPVVVNNQPAPVASQIWYSDGLMLNGWAWDTHAPHRHMEVTIREGSRLLGRVICDKPCQEITCTANSDHGFNFVIPWELADGKLHTLDIENDLGQPLSGSPITVCAWPEGLEGLLQQYDQSPDEQTFSLLSQVAKEQALFLPKSASFRHYTQWFEVFQGNSISNINMIHGKVGLLLISEGDVALESISLASLRTQRGIEYQIAKGSADDLLSAVAHLLKDGCASIVPLIAGDRLASNSLVYLSSLLKEDSVAWGYVDCDRDGQKGERSLPWLKPVWDIDLFIGADIFTPGAIFSAPIVNQALGLLKSVGTLQILNWHFLCAAIALATERERATVIHLPQILYHRNFQAPASPEQANPSLDRHQAIAWLCHYLNPGSLVRTLPDYPALLRVYWSLPINLPRVSLIIPTRDQVKLLRTCVEGLLENTDYPNLEIIVIDNQSSDQETLEYLNELPSFGVKVIAYPYIFNYSAINNYAVTHATGDIIGLINNDVEVIESSWLKEMVSQLLRPQVGAVGAKLLWSNRIVQHGGVVVGVNGLAAHSGNNLEQRDPGYLGTNQITRRQSAVTAACMLIRKSIFNEVGGLDNHIFQVTFNDVDLCLRIQQLGFHIIWTPFAQLIHAESASRGKDQTQEKRARAKREQHGFIDRWHLIGQNDPFYHPALSLDFLSGPYGGLAIPPRSLKERHSCIRMILPSAVIEEKQGL